MYGSAIWGFGKNGIIEKLHLQFCRNVLKVRTSTPCYMIYGELGRVPLDCRLKLNMVMFWNRLVQCENKLSTTLYKLMLRLSEHENVQFKWLNMVKCILDETGFSEYWTDQNLRTCNLKLPTETGRWRNIPSDERYCTLLVGNEFHYSFVKIRH